MKKNNKKIIIAIVVFAVLILIVGIALAFVLKNNNKDAFFKYASQLFDNENGFIDNRIQQYNEKKNSNLYENKGTFTVNVPTDNLDEETASKINNDFNISFMGNVDNVNGMAEELININYGKDAKFPISFKRVDDVYALKLSKIMQKYIAIDTSNEDSNLLSGIGINTEILNSFEFTNEEKDKFKNEYLQIIKDNLEESSFSKVSTTDSEGYMLEIENQKLQEIIIKIFEKLKDDEQMLDKLGLKPDNIDTLIENIDMGEGKINITVYQKDNKLNRIVIQLYDSLKIDITKTSDESNLSYKIALTSSMAGDMLGEISVGYSGLDNLETVTENYTIGIDYSGNSYTYNIENEINFTDVDINDFKEGEYVDLQTLSSSSIATLFQTIGEKFTQINNDLMEQISIDPDDFWMSFIPTNTVSTSYDSDEFDYDFDDFDDFDEPEIDDEKQENSNKISNNTTTSTTNKIESKNSTAGDDLATSLSETEKNVFNSKYKAYEGDNVNGSDIKQLIMSIIANNMADEDRQIKVTGDITLTGNEIPDSVETGKKYEVKLKYSDEGYVNEVNITEK